MRKEIYTKAEGRYFNPRRLRNFFIPLQSNGAYKITRRQIGGGEIARVYITDVQIICAEIIGAEIIGAKITGAEITRRKSKPENTEPENSGAAL